ncbi:hypothetical protein GCM10011390_30210 [Aureimonas endophytica]|uniref:Uncharacterized protein n=1 Tax=Aureimonas endophytica TaxID=2027858 RepID=A0A917E6V1_9HYPH|nr:hypothetical protein GCM10011390_30210 [Aureimonas endophytica]
MAQAPKPISETVQSVRPKRRVAMGMGRLRDGRARGASARARAGEKGWARRNLDVAAAMGRGHKLSWLQ